MPLYYIDMRHCEWKCATRDSFNEHIWIMQTLYKSAVDMRRCGFSSIKLFDAHGRNIVAIFLGRHINFGPGFSTLFGSFCYLHSRASSNFNRDIQHCVDTFMTAFIVLSCLDLCLKPDTCLGDGSEISPNTPLNRTEPRKGNYRQLNSFAHFHSEIAATVN